MISGCQKEEAVPEETEIIEAEDGETEQENFRYMTPLSGEPSEEHVLNRPVVVTINNHPLARPQSGLQDADIIFELIAEGNVTRFLAVYQSEMPGRVGPVRSARDYFIDIAKGFNALYIAHGYSPDAKAKLDSGEIDHLNGMKYDGQFFHRSSDRKAPHNSYTSGEDIQAGAEREGFELQLAEEDIPVFPFYKEPSSSDLGEAASQVTVAYSSNDQFINHYRYDTTSGFYERDVAGEVTTDKETGEALSLANVVVLEMPHRTIDSEGRQEVTLEGTGNAWLFQSGRVIKGTWTNEDGLFMLQAEDDELRYNPGQTWIHIIPTNRGLDSMVTYTN